MCWGKSDGSTVDAYNLDGAGYVEIGTSPASGYLKTMRYNSLGAFSKAVGGTYDSYYCDYFSVIASGVQFALRGGASSSGSNCGAFYVARADGAGNRAWLIGAAPSYI